LQSIAQVRSPHSFPICEKSGYFYFLFENQTGFCAMLGTLLRIIARSTLVSVRELNDLY
jgi:hypothetical protein